MRHGRYEHAAVLADNARSIYVFGGLPSGICGRSIERYIMARDRFEMLPLQLPESLHKFALFPVTHSKIAILGGDNCNRAYLFDIGSNSI